MLNLLEISKNLKQRRIGKNLIKINPSFSNKHKSKLMFVKIKDHLNNLNNCVQQKAPHIKKGITLERLLKIIQQGKKTKAAQNRLKV